MGDRPPWWGHMAEICDSLIHVPLIVRHPEAIEPGTRISGITQTHDIFATCCEVAGAEVPSPAREQSRSLISAARGEGLRAFALSEAYKPVQVMERILRRYPDFDVRKYNYSLKSWRSTTEKYVWRSDGRDEYYRVDEDPWNRNNLIEQNQQRASELRQMMLDYLLSIPRNEFGDLQSAFPGKSADPEIAAKLQALGLYRKVLDWPEWAAQ
jgi:arylsulfatase A-like enzyme